MEHLVGCENYIDGFLTLFKMECDPPGKEVQLDGNHQKGDMSIYRTFLEYLKQEMFQY